MQRPYKERRALLEALFTDHALTSLWLLCPMTTDLATAREWLESRTDVSGVEGLVSEPLNSRHLTGFRGWHKVRRRDTTEAIIGAITGTLTRPGLLGIGRHDDAGRLRMVVGRSRCARRCSGSWASTRPRPAPGTRSKGCGSRRPGARAGVAGADDGTDDTIPPFGRPLPAEGCRLRLLPGHRRYGWSART
ncbi:hypothetical protein [Streptomyces sp. NPDC054787]